MKFSNYLFSVSLLLMLTTETYSQNISRFLEDGHVSESKNILSIGYDLLNGEIPFKIEHSVTSKFSFEVGGGPVWLAKQNWLFMDNPLPIKETGVGFSAFIKVKLYFRTFPERMYITIYPKINWLDHAVFTDAAVMNVGYQRIIVNKILLGAEAGFGFRIYRDTSWAFLGEKSEIIWKPQIPLTCNISYLF